MIPIKMNIVSIFVKHIDKIIMYEHSVICLHAHCAV